MLQWVKKVPAGTFLVPLLIASVLLPLSLISSLSAE